MGKEIQQKKKEKCLYNVNRYLLLPIKMKICQKAIIVTFYIVFHSVFLLYFVGKTILLQEPAF